MAVVVRAWTGDLDLWDQGLRKEKKVSRPVNQTELQILALAKEDLSPEQIALSLGLDEEAVMYVLARHGNLKEDEVSDDDFKRIQARLIDIAKHTEDDYLAANVGKFIWERKKGAVKDYKSAPSINVNKLNMLITASNSFVEDFQKKLKTNGSNGKTTSGPTVEISDGGRTEESIEAAASSNQAS